MHSNAPMVLLVPVIPGVVITEPGAVSWDSDLLDASARGLENLGLAIAQVVVFTSFTALQPVISSWPIGTMPNLVQMCMY